MLGEVRGSGKIPINRLPEAFLKIYLCLKTKFPFSSRGIQHSSWLSFGFRGVPDDLTFEFRKFGNQRNQFFNISSASASMEYLLFSVEIKVSYSYNDEVSNLQKNKHKERDCYEKGITNRWERQGQKIGRGVEVKRLEEFGVMEVARCFSKG